MTKVYNRLKHANSCKSPQSKDTRYKVKVSFKDKAPAFAPVHYELMSSG